MKRRDALAAFFASSAAPVTVLSQTAGKVWRIGVLSRSIPPEPGMRPYIGHMLAPFGYELGRNLQIDYKYAQNQVETLPKLAAELVEAKPDLLIGMLMRDGFALKQATTTIPIVMMYATNPVQLGLIKSLAQPGGNITGTTAVSPELYSKTFQIMRELLPQATHMAYLSDPDGVDDGLYRQQVEHVARSLGIRLSNYPVRTVTDLDSALSNLLRDRPHALNVIASGVMIEHDARIIEFAARHKMPAHYMQTDPVFRGGLISYSADFRAMGARNAWMIDKIFKGAKPSDIPMEEPARFRLVLNMKTAKAMGLVIPPTVMLQVTQVIE